MKRYYCTYFDRNYLVKALALYDSLTKIANHEFELHVICLDDFTFTLLNHFHLPELKLMSLSDLERAEPELLAVKNARTLLEYYWTMTPVVANRILLDHPEIDILTYVDADLYFFDSPEPLFAEMKEGSVLICGHKFSPEVAHVEPTAGTYNVGLVAFRSDPDGLEVLRTWRRQCLEWCAAVYQEGKYGDQLYLNDWPERFKRVVVCETYGAAIGPWNHTKYRFENQNGKALIDGYPLIFYHYHALLVFKKKVFMPAVHLVYKIREDVLRICFIPYLEALEAAAARITGQIPEFVSGLDAVAPFTQEHVYLIRGNVGFSDPLGRRPADIGRGWHLYSGDQLLTGNPVIVNKALAPVGPEELNRRGAASLSRGELDMAITWYTQSLALLSEQPEVHRKLAVAFAAKNQIDKAGRHLGLAAGLVREQTKPATSGWPTITLVTPSYNQGEYLEACIQSVLGQRYPNLEYIIMDGGSRDQSVDIIRKYSPYLHFWQSKPDGGQYAAIQEGFTKGHGDILAWLNSDDLLQPGALWVVAKIFRFYPEIEWIMGRPAVYNVYGELDSLLGYFPEWSRRAYLEGRIGPPHIQQESTFWRRSLYEKAGNRIETRMKLAGDCELWGRFFRHAKLHTVDALLAGFRCHEAQKTAVAGVYEAEARQVVVQEKAYFDAATDKTLLPAPPTLTMPDLIYRAQDKLSVDAFPYFLYSRKSHFNYFERYARIHPGRVVPAPGDDLSVYQELLVFSLIKDVLPPGSRLLQIGDSASPLLSVLASEYECWLLGTDEADGRESGASETRRVRGTIGDFCSMLPDGEFDFVFSIGVLGKIPVDTVRFHDLCRDLDRLIKDGGLSLHCFEVYVSDFQVWSPELMSFMKNYFAAPAPGNYLAQMRLDPDAYFMTDEAYASLRKRSGRTLSSAQERLASCNLLFKKNDALSRFRQKEHFRLNREGETAFLQGDPDEAGRFFKAALMAEPGYGMAHNNLGALYWKQGDAGAALSSFKAALAHDSSNRVALWNALEMTEPSKRYEVLRQELWAYMRECPQDKTVLFSLVRAQEVFLKEHLNQSVKEDGAVQGKSFQVSVVVVSTGKDALRATLSDLARQSLRSLEIVVVSADNQDNPAKIIAECRLQGACIRHLRTAGVLNKTLARNLGLFTAQGEFVGTLDTGIRTPSDRYEQLMARFSGSPAVALVLSGTKAQSLSFSESETLFSGLRSPHVLWRRKLHQTDAYFNEAFPNFGPEDFFFRLRHSYSMGILASDETGMVGKQDYPSEVMAEWFNLKMGHHRAARRNSPWFYTSKQLIDLINEYIRVISGFLTGNQIEDAVVFFKTHRSAFPNLKELLDLDSRIKRLMELRPSVRQALKYRE